MQRQKGLSLENEVESLQSEMGEGSMSPIPIHPGLATWSGTDYAEGLRARFADIAMPDDATHSYRCGWEDADTELLESARHKRVLAEGREDDFGATWGVLFDAGGDARGHGIAFDETRTQPWKEGWIDVDIKMGMAGLE
jgi:hypothetical protein